MQAPSVYAQSDPSQWYPATQTCLHTALRSLVTPCRDRNGSLGLIASVCVPFKPGSSGRLPTSVYEPNRLVNCEAISKLDGADAQCVTQGLCLSHMIAVDYGMVVSQGTADKVAHIAHSC